MKLNGRGACQTHLNSSRSSRRRSRGIPLGVRAVVHAPGRLLAVCGGSRYGRQRLLIGRSSTWKIESELLSDKLEEG